MSKTLVVPAAAEQFADEMCRCPGSWGSKIVLAGMGFDEGDEVLD